MFVYYPRRLKALNFDNSDNSHNSFRWPEYFIDYLCERWIPCQACVYITAQWQYTAVHLWNNFPFIKSLLNSKTNCFITLTSITRNIVLIKGVMQGKLIAVVYTLRKHWNQFSLGRICKQDWVQLHRCSFSIRGG